MCTHLSYLSSLTRISNFEFWYDRAVAIGAGLASFAGSFWTLTAGLWATGSAVYSLVSVGAGALASLGLAVVCGSRLTLRPQLKHLTNNSPRDGIIQDAFLYNLLFFFAAWMPLAVYRNEHLRGWESWLALGAFLSPAAVAFLWFIETDFRHLKFERSLPIEEVARRCSPRRIDAHTNGQRIRVLQRHVRCQALLAFSLSVAMTIGGLIADAGKGVSVQGHLRVLRELASEHFIPILKGFFGRDRK